MHIYSKKLRLDFLHQSALWFVWVSLEEIKTVYANTKFRKEFTWPLSNFFQMLIHMVRLANTKNQQLYNVVTHF
jgi:hypothetical protein